jgi:hypothetical protein
MPSKIFTKGSIVLSLIFVCMHQPSCKKIDGYNDVVSTDLTKPGPVSNVQVKNFNGGAYITYTLPDSKNILYVQAQYNINDKTSRQTKSSYYSDSVTVSGFAKSQDYNVILYVVSRANVLSDSVTVTVHPETPPYLLAYASLKLEDDFGGVNIQAVNPSGANIGIITIFPDAVTKKLEIVDQNYTNQDSINYSLRGYDTLPKSFGVYVTDQWGNISDTLFQTIHPIYETLMDKSLFKQYTLPTDVPKYQNNDLFNLPNMWNNNTTDFYNTMQPILPNSDKSFIWPAWVTFDIGQTAKLSRYTLWERSGDNDELLWTYGSPQTWVLWGRADIPKDEMMPVDSSNLPPVGSVTPNGWINLGVFHAPAKPSGLPNPQYTNADLSFWLNGFGFNFDLSLPPVRYIRFECFQTMGGTNNFFDMSEISMYGKNN